MPTIFVYGTLKRGHGNHARFIAPDPGSNFIGEAVSVSTDYALLDFGAPILFKDQPGGHPVKGELFDVSDEVLARIDRLEGHPYHYRREQQRFILTGDAGAVHTAWVYLSARSLPPTLADRPAPINEEGRLVWPRPVQEEEPTCIFLGDDEYDDFEQDENEED